MKRISIVIPAYNEAPGVPEMRERLTKFLDSCTAYDFEVVIVDDHSSDETPERIKQWADQDPRINLVRLSRNCGSHAAFHAGLSECTGDAAVFLAADLQDPPEFIPELAERWEQNSDVVWAVRSAREGEKTSVKLFARVFYGTLRRLALSDMPPQGSDFFLLDRKVIDAYLDIPEKNTSFLCLILWMGFNQSFISYVKQARASGVSKWTLARKIKLFVDSIVSFSFTPIRAMSWMGVGFAVSGFVFACSVIVARLAGWVVGGTGYAAIMTVMLMGFGLTMLMLGVIGEYLWRTFDESRGRPRYILQERYPLAKRANQVEKEDNNELSLG